MILIYTKKHFQFINSQRQQNPVKSTAERLLEFERDGVLRRCYPNMHVLTLMNMIIPASTAVVERSFSLMNNLCTPLRNFLNQVSLESLMRICWEGKESYPPEDLESLVDRFRDMKDRMLIL